MKNNISDLRNHLFEVIERLKDPEPQSPMDTETAETICLAAKRLIEIARVEIEFWELTDSKAGNEFLQIPKLEKNSEPHEGPGKRR